MTPWLFFCKVEKYFEIADKYRHNPTPQRLQKAMNLEAEITLHIKEVRDKIKFQTIKKVNP